MRLILDIAKRYLLGKKSTNAINLITWVSISGIAIGTAALILILSVFNGFKTLLSGLYNSFNPDLLVVPKEGKVFDTDTSALYVLNEIEGIELISRTIEEIALFEYKGSQKVGKIKGVDDNFRKVTKIDSTLRSGKFILRQEGINYGVLGSGMNAMLSINHNDAINPITVYMPLRKRKGPLSKEYKSRNIYPSGVFSVQSEADIQYILASYPFVNDLLDLEEKNSALEIKLSDDADEETVKSEIKKVLGEDFIIKNRYQQDEAFLKIMNMEKWVSYLIACLMLTIIAFNLVGSLWMIVLDKKKDIAILRSMGFDSGKVLNVFLFVGVFICLTGLVIGTIAALILYAMQKYYGLVTIPDGFMINSYPIDLNFMDFIIVMITVMSIGIIASFFPALRASRVTAYVRQE